MHPYLLLAVDMFHGIPAWGSLAVIVSAVLGLWGLSRYLAYRFQCNIDAAIRSCCEPLRDARVDVHAVEPAERPRERSTGASDDAARSSSDPACLDFGADVGWFWIDATIEPRDRAATWDPRILELVDSNFEPAADFEVCEESGELRTVKVWRNGAFGTPREKCLTGPQRLRMLFAIPVKLHDAKFACQDNCFGKIELPQPLAICS